MVESINAITPLEEARATLASAYDLRFTKAVERVTAVVHEKLKRVVAAEDWPALAPLIVHVNRLKRDRRILVLAHYFQIPAICHGVADLTGDTMMLATRAAKARNRTVMVCGAGFVAETVKLLSPGKTVLQPDSRATCSVAASITREDVLAIRAQYPGVPVIASINSTAAVKAVSDICCTPASALAIIEQQPGDRVILVPDQYLARNLAKRTAKKLITWSGTCEALDGLTAADLAKLRSAHPDIRVIAHACCPPEIVAAADYNGATGDLLGWLRRERPGRVAMLAERSAVENATVMFPDTVFAPAAPGRHEPRITLETLLWAMHTLTEKVEVRADLIEPASAAIVRMTRVARKAG